MKQTPNKQMKQRQRELEMEQTEPKQSTSPKESSFGFFSELFGFSNTTDNSSSKSPRSPKSPKSPKPSSTRLKGRTLFSKLKLNSFAFFPTSASSEARESKSKKMSKLNISGVQISSPTNFTHVTGTSKLNLISLEDAKRRENLLYEKANKPTSLRNEQPVKQVDITNSGVKEGWIRLLDSKTNEFYYYNQRLNRTQWEKP